MRDQLQPGEAIYLHTRLVVREDSLTLYGFETKEGRHFFDLLLGVDGVGPRSALALLSTLNPDTIRRAVFNEQADILCRAKLARKPQKIPFYLVDRIPTGDAQLPAPVMLIQVLAALTTLGYSVVEAQAALQIIPRCSTDVETRLRLALQYFRP
jgi:Holliday junction DNA helicase RuvA